MDTLCGFSCYGIVCPAFFGPLGVAAERLGRTSFFFFEKTVGTRIIENSEPGIRQDPGGNHFTWLSSSFTASRFGKPRRGVSGSAPT
jgi:hypothetical protein